MSERGTRTKKRFFFSNFAPIRTREDQVRVQQVEFSICRMQTVDSIERSLSRIFALFIITKTGRRIQELNYSRFEQNFGISIAQKGKWG